MPTMMPFQLILDHLEHFGFMLMEVSGFFHDHKSNVGAGLLAKAVCQSTMQ